MTALSEMEQDNISSTPPQPKAFLDARNVLIVRLLLRNAQRSGAIRGLTVGEFNKRRRDEEEDLILMRVREHKNRATSVCQLVLGMHIFLPLSSSL